jgi:hypothetical protein
MSNNLPKNRSYYQSSYWHKRLVNGQISHVTQSVMQQRRHEADSGLEAEDRVFEAKYDEWMSNKQGLSFDEWILCQKKLSETVA